MVFSFILLFVLSFRQYVDFKVNLHIQLFVLKNKGPIGNRLAASGLFWQKVANSILKDLKQILATFLSGNA